MRTEMAAMVSYYLPIKSRDTSYICTEVFGVVLIYIQKRYPAAMVVLDQIKER